MELGVGGLCMRTFRRAAVFTADAGLLAFCAVAGGVGSALAGGGGSALGVTAPAVTVSPHLAAGCENLVATGAVQQQANCTAGPRTIDNPTVIGIYVYRGAVSPSTGAQLGPALDASWTLSCVVNGRTVTAP